MAQDVDDVLAVLLLARAAGLVQAGAEGRTEVPLDVAPLFETVPDLQRSGAVLRRMAANPVVRAHLRGRGDVQHVMLGYSDSNKESGYLASRCALLAAEEALAEAAGAHALQLRLFHGRGGTASRGGSKPRDAILADPLGSPALRLTEQGEIIHAKYGLPDMALRTLELMGSAMLERALGPGTPAPAPVARTALTACAEASRAHYRALVAETPEFFAYFNAATPIDVIMRLRIGSRPASRRAHEGIGDLRAIPWVFSWMQNRQMLPGWFGLGTGLERGIAEHGLALFADMARTWPYFQVALRDAAAVLGKSDMAIGARYAALAGAAGAPIWTRIAEEHARATAQILRITGAPTLLHHEPQLQRSIEARNPKVDVLSLVQLRALPAWREGGRADPELLEVLLRSVKGIARALQNTG
jgi:phosphoenolpyruvate carboxylase